jgi:hypothetical protein
MDKAKEDIYERNECSDLEEECCCCCADPEDTIENLEKMSAEEKKEYLDYLSFSRSFTCCG